jgi:gamma-glutamyltranspeptidase/glutathione hydrolase
VLREGGNAVDAAVCAVLASFATESPLTGFGAGGFMLVHTGEEDVLLDFFVEAPGRDGHTTSGELTPISISFGETAQIFNVGPGSCGIPGTAAGLAEAARRFGSLPLSDLVEPARRLAAGGVEVTPQQAYLFSVLAPILTSTPESSALYAPGGELLGEGDTFLFPDLAEALERFGAEGPDFLYGGRAGEQIVSWLGERGSAVGRADLEAYQVVEREPARAMFRGREVLTNPPPSSGGILVAFCLRLLEELGEGGADRWAEVMEEANLAREEGFHSGLYEDGYLERFLSDRNVREAAQRLRDRRTATAAGGGPEDRLGSTTHISVLDAEGMCASVTCSNGSGSGVVVPGTGVHLNNMLGEEDLNPLGFHLTPPGERITSMMAPTIVLHEGEVEVALGSAGSNRIRSAILQTITRVVEEGKDSAEAVEAGRLHLEAGIVQAEPGVDEEALARLESRGYGVARWRAKNLFFGGVQAVARDPETGEMTGAGDPRRGGTAVVVE